MNKKITTLVLILIIIGAGAITVFNLRGHAQEKKDTIISALLVKLTPEEIVNQSDGIMVGTVKDLKSSGWVETKKPKPGCVLVWAETDFNNNNLHRHIGFYIGKEKATSNNSKHGYPTEHDWKFRKIESILWNSKLKK